MHKTSKHTPDLHLIIDKVIRPEVKPGSSRLMNEVGRATGFSSSALASGAVWTTLAAIIQRSERSEISTIVPNYFKTTGILVVESRNFGSVLAGTWQHDFEFSYVL